MRRDLDGLEWDEYGQGYDPATGQCVICVCGVDLRQAENQPHRCPYDDPEGTA